jgi:nucleoid-associated protein YgaU
MKFSAALLVASLAAAVDAFSVQHATTRVGTEMYARQPIMAGNWKVSVALFSPRRFDQYDDEVPPEHESYLR